MEVEEGGGRPLRLIDFGACVDLRSGHNYVPSETVLDPRYAAPENYVLPPNSSPAPIPDPLSSLGSPLVWALWSPDRFDLFSAVRGGAEGAGWLGWGWEERL